MGGRRSPMGTVFSVSRAAICILAFIFTGCQQPNRASSPSVSGDSTPVVARDIRVLLSKRHAKCRVGSDGPFTIINENGRVVYRGKSAAGAVVSVDRNRRVLFGKTVLGTGFFDIVPGRAGPLELSYPVESGWSPGRRYGGKFRVSAGDSGRLRVVNYVDLETYIACVLPAELFPHFETEAYRAQAIAARTYALYQMAQRSSRSYDVVATEASQVYPGLQKSGAADRAREATRYTRGIVATWTSPTGEQIFCTFYSSCCGGRTQPVSQCRPNYVEIPPLSGNVPCNCGRVSTSYRWKRDTRLSKSELAGKLRSRFPKSAELGDVRAVEVASRSQWGRPTLLRIYGSRGKQLDMPAEEFRLAVGSRVLRSTQFRAIDRGRDVEFVDGRGFGHGMGLCQWGMQEKALIGWDASAILKHYYPTMHLTRAY